MVTGGIAVIQRSSALVELQRVLRPPHKGTYLDDEFQLETFLTEGGALGVRIVGELDMATAERLTDAVAAWPKPLTQCVVDLSECNFVDSSGIRALLLCQRELDGGEGILQLTGVSPHVERVLRIAGVQGVLQIAAAAEPLGSDDGQ
jgi:anti-anti-sigma factor